jgi:DNA-binding response OmpR family regulator
MSAASSRVPRVLVVDDEADLRELLELTLLKMGLDVDSAATLAEARALLATEYQLVLTDMRLPDGLGWSWCAKSRPPTRTRRWRWSRPSAAPTTRWWR